MKYIKTYEKMILGAFTNNIEDAEPEVVKLFDYLKMLTMNIKEDETDGNYSGFLKIEINRDDKEWKTYSIILDAYYYFIYQFDYKEDGMWIKYTCNEKTKEHIEKLEIFFDEIAKKKNEWGWCFDRETFMREFDHIDMYINANKYNL